jgi:26S proteasome regulatory subunit N9
MTFKRPATDRQLTFEEISRETRLPVNEVELLVMKALAQGLVRGAIDQVASNVHMTWVQPRVLDKQQVQYTDVYLISEMFHILWASFLCCTVSVVRSRKIQWSEWVVLNVTATHAP